MISDSRDVSWQSPSTAGYLLQNKLGQKNVSHVLSGCQELQWKQILQYIIIKLQTIHSILDRTSQINFLRTFLLQYYLHESLDKFQCFKRARAWWIFNFSTLFLFSFSYNFFRGIICPRFCEASQMSASDWGEAGCSDKRWLRLILIRRGEKVNARDKFIWGKKDCWDGHNHSNHSNDEIDTDTDTHSRA